MVDDPDIRWAVEDALLRLALRDEIIDAIAPWYGDNREAAKTWLKTSLIPGYGRTGAELLNEGHGVVVLRHVEQINGKRRS